MIRLCYEASYVGFCLQRDLRAHGVALRGGRAQQRTRVSWCRGSAWISGSTSSGGRHNRLGITKQGNRYSRTALVEANQRGYRSSPIGKELKARRQDSTPELIAIADRCMRRLNKKGNRLLLVGKHPNKVKGACTRRRGYQSKVKTFSETPPGGSS